MEWAAIVPRIFIGSRKAVEDIEFLKNNNIGLIVNASNSPKVITPLNIPTYYIANIMDVEYSMANLSDSYWIELLKKLDVILQIMHKFYLDGKSILVHCYAGINRSALIIALFMIKYLNYSYEQTYEILLRANRGRDLPALQNRTFCWICKHAYNARIGRA